MMKIRTFYPRLCADKKSPSQSSLTGFFARCLWRERVQGFKGHVVAFKVTTFAVTKRRPFGTASIIQILIVTGQQ